MSVMTVPFGCTKQHTRDVYAVAVARNRTEQSGELAPPHFQMPARGRPGRLARGLVCTACQRTSIVQGGLASG